MCNWTFCAAPWLVLIIKISQGTGQKVENTCNFYCNPEMLGIIFIFMLWLNFILGLNFNSLCFKLFIIHYHTKNKGK